METLFETLEFDFPIRLMKLSEKTFRVEYGLEVKDGDYAQSAANLGQAIMHAVTIS